MSKTFTYILIVIGAYLLIIFPKLNSKSEKETETETENEADTKSGTGLSENTDENGVSRGASGQQKYRIGYTK